MFTKNVDSIHFLCWAFSCGFIKNSPTILVWLYILHTAVYHQARQSRLCQSGVTSLRVIISENSSVDNPQPISGNWQTCDQMTINEGVRTLRRLSFQIFFPIFVFAYLEECSVGMFCCHIGIFF